MINVEYPTNADIERLLRREVPRTAGRIDVRRLSAVVRAHTPGPWCVGSDSACDIGNPVAVMVGPDGNANSDVLVGCSHDLGYFPDPAANARLIAAAPALLFATLALFGRLAPLRDAAKRAGLPFDHDGTLDVLDDAIHAVARVAGERPAEPGEG